jgi:hypothetical protein
MKDEAVLRDRARRAMLSGRLPGRRPDRIWGGPSGGAECAICGARVTPDELDFEIEFFRNEGDRGVDRHHVHIHCLAAWETELYDGYPKNAPSDEVA